MKIVRRGSIVLWMAALLPLPFAVPLVMAQVVTGHVVARPGTLARDEAALLLPPAVFFAGHSASVQARNSAGFRFDNGRLVLATLVDTSGYSNGLQERYQFYLIVETPLKVGGKLLEVGAYGAGFVGSQFVVMNIAGDPVLAALSTRDTLIARPTPLQILPGPQPGSLRLYVGRDFVELTAATVN